MPSFIKANMNPIFFKHGVALRDEPHLLKIALACGASAKFSARKTSLSVSPTRRGAGAWSVLEILGANDDPLR